MSEMRSHIRPITRVIAGYGYVLMKFLCFVVRLIARKYPLKEIHLLMIEGEVIKWALRETLEGKLPI